MTSELIPEAIFTVFGSRLEIPAAYRDFSPKCPKWPKSAQKWGFPLKTRFLTCATLAPHLNVEIYQKVRFLHPFGHEKGVKTAVFLVI